MPEPSDAQAELWIVQGPDVVSGKLRLALTAKGIQQVSQVAPDTVVLRMTAASAEQLKAELPELIVEINRALC
jgi:hypothetical protein